MPVICPLLSDLFDYRPAEGLCILEDKSADRWACCVPSATKKADQIAMKTECHSQMLHGASGAGCASEQDVLFAKHE
jgi:hypothetical protein